MIMRPLCFLCCRVMLHKVISASSNTLTPHHMYTCTDDFDFFIRVYFRKYEYNQGAVVGTLCTYKSQMLIKPVNKINRSFIVSLKPPSCCLAPV